MSTYDGTGIYRFTQTVTTTDATVTTCGTYTMPNEATAYVRAIVMGRSAGANTVCYELSASANRETGTLAIVGSATDHIYENTAAPSFAGCDATTDVSGNDIRVRVTGLAATTITWQAFVEVHVYVA